MVDLALEGINVLDFSQGISGPYCTKLMSDLGARIIKVERPDGGDVSRRMGPFLEDNPHLEKSGSFLALNSNKLGITLNLRTETARKIARQLIVWSDIIVESFPPGVMESFSLDWVHAQQLKPELVYTSISNFGQSGPYRNYRSSEIIAYAMGGEMYSTGLEGLEPLKLGGTVSLFQAGSIAAIATLGALFVSRDQNVGQQVDISIMEALIANQDRRAPGLLAYQYTGEVTTRLPHGSTAYPMGIYQCKDGYFELMAGLVRFQGAVRMLGNPDWLKDPKWHTATAQSDPDLKEEFNAHFRSWCLKLTKQELWELAQANRVLSGPVNNISDVMNDPVLNQRGSFTKIEHPFVGTLKYPGRPFRMTGSPSLLDADGPQGQKKARPAPTLGQHNQEVICGMLNYSPTELIRLREQ